MNKLAQQHKIQQARQKELFNFGLAKATNTLFRECAAYENSVFSRFIFRENSVTAQVYYTIGSNIPE